MEIKEALKILCEDRNRIGKINDEDVDISPLNIKINLECNDYELDLEFIQDLIRIDPDTWDRELYQGHSLKEVSFD